MIFTKEAVKNRHAKTAAALDKVIGAQDVVLVFSGEPIQKPGGLDQAYDFLPHPDYYWLTGSRRPFGVSAYSKNAGWTEFVFLVDRNETIWEGAREHVEGRSVAEFESWYKSQNFSQTFLIGQHKQTHLSKVPVEEQRKVQEAFNEVRRIKDAEEIQLVQSLAQMAAQGYQRVKNFIRPGVTERQIQLEYEFEVLKQGAHTMPYGSIVGAGTNSAILHAVPTDRIVKSGDLILIDAGADQHDYCVDITRVFSADGVYSERQRTIIDIVKNAQKKSIELCKPGVEWRDVHLAAAQVVAQGLKDLKVLNCSVETALEKSVVGAFLPHGVGHMVGLRVRDVGGIYTDTPKSYNGARLRVDMKLQEGFLMTVEPGLYFIPALLDDVDTRARFQSDINWNEAEKWKDFGGVRLEDDIHVTANGPVNLTACVEKL